MRARKVMVVVVAAGLVVVSPARRAGAQCGSAVLGEKDQPAVFQGITLGPSTVAWLWMPGEADKNALDGACDAGCLSILASPLCEWGGDCTAVTGIEWLNGSCETAGYLPQTSVLLLEAPTAADGGRWAAIKVDHNAGDANFDLDAAATAICGPSCAAVGSPYAGGFGQGIDVLGAEEAGGVLTLKLGWEAPSPAAEALNLGGEDLVTSYSIYWARSTGGGTTPPVLTGEKPGWTRVDDSDGKQIAGYSTDTKATVSVSLGGSSEAVYVALGLNLDGTGDPGADANTVASSFISRGTLVYLPGSAAPLAASVSPAEGSTAGGGKIVTTGTGFASDATVTVGGSDVADLSFISANRLRCTTPAGTVGTADVTVTTSAGSSTLVAGYRYLDLPPVALAVDAEAGAGTTGDLNGVLEPGEVVSLAPTWENLTGGVQTLAGHAGGFIGPAGATYSTTDTEADYGIIGTAGAASCSDAPSDCYSVGVTDPPTRPSLHWDARLVEVLSTGEVKTWTVHIGGSFGDVPLTYWAYPFIERMLHRGITGGCGAGNYCPGSAVSRWQMAVFLSAAITGGAGVPSAGTVPGMGSYDCRAGGTSVFSDISPTDAGCPFIHFIAAKGITGGCGGGRYCPWSTVDRWQMAIFLTAAMLDGDPVPVSGSVPGMGDYNCVSGGESVFGDVPPTDAGCPSIHYIAAEGVTGGCGGGNYCPHDSLSRAQMAVFMTGAFDLTLYGP